METLTIAILVVILWFFIGLVLGYQSAIHYHEIPDVQKVNKYIQDNFPNQWAAYQKGVFEGYEQGVKDGKNPPL